MLGLRADWAASSVRLRTRESPKIPQESQVEIRPNSRSPPRHETELPTGEVPIILTFVILACSRSWQCNAGNFRILLVDDFAFFVRDLFRSHLADG